MSKFKLSYDDEPETHTLDFFRHSDDNAPDGYISIVAGNWCLGRIYFNEGTIELDSAGCSQVGLKIIAPDFHLNEFLHQIKKKDAKKKKPAKKKIIKKK